MAPTLMSAGVPEAARGEGWIGHQQVVSLLLFPPPPSSPSPPHQELFLGQKLCVPTEGVCLTGDAGGCCFWRVV